MTVINTTGYDIRNIEGWDDLDLYTEAASQVLTDHDANWKSDEQIIREIEQAVLKGTGFIISSADCDRLFPRRD